MRPGFTWAQLDAEMRVSLPPTKAPGRNLIEMWTGATLLVVSLLFLFPGLCLALGILAGSFFGLLLSQPLSPGLFFI